MRLPVGDENLDIDLKDGVLSVTFTRVRQRNAMTWGMYQALEEACDFADRSDEVSVLTLKSAAPEAFVAGTDIKQFKEFGSGADGLTYEARIGTILGKLESVSVPTLAVIRGFCVGGGLGLAAACDIRVATPDAKFGVPIARTLGNCLSADTISRLLAHLGPAVTAEMLLRGRLFSGAEAAALGFVGTLADEGDLDEVAAGVEAELSSHAPLSMWASKTLMRRSRLAAVPEDEDVVERVYGSRDFREGVAAFTERRAPQWEGR